MEGASGASFVYVCCVGSMWQFTLHPDTAKYSWNPMFALHPNREFVNKHMKVTYLAKKDAAAEGLVLELKVTYLAKKDAAAEGLVLELVLLVLAGLRLP